MITLREVRFEETTIPLCRPFGFGVATLHSLTHLKLLARFTVRGEPAGGLTSGERTVTGIAGENLVPRWFVKDASISLDEDIDRLRQAIHRTAARAVDRAAPTPFAFWWSLYQSEAANNPAQPGLVTQLAVSLIERAAIDAWCGCHGMTFAAAVRNASLGVCAEQVHPALAGMSPAEAIPAVPRGTLPVRHTVGLADDIGLIPTALERTGISRLKIKLGGDPAADVARIIEIMRSATGRIERITLDGNENYATIAALEDFLDRLAATPEAAPAAAALAWIEQPLHRSVSLSPELRSMFDRRPKLTMLLDESDASPADLPHALDLGYAGTTHKNCKGVFKTILAAMLLKQRSRAGRRLLLSGEDLTIVAPWAQAQDLAVAAAVGVVDIERNGQAFADGLQAFSLVDQGGALDRYGSLYRATSSGVELAIEAGSVDVTGSNLCAFGCWGC